jgi:hypothetical protein
MAFDFASAKANLRRTVQTTFGVEAFYKDASLSVPTPITARYNHKKIDRMGDLVEAGYAEVLESIERIVLVSGDTPALEFKRNGVVTFSDMPGVEFILTAREPKTNATDDVWQVVRA